MTTPINPHDLVWHKGEPPPIDSVTDDARIMAWIVWDFPEGHESATKNGQVSRFKMLMPMSFWETRRWTDAWKEPVPLVERVTHWAWMVESVKGDWHGGF